LKFSPVETAIVCELLVRGAQTPGELRSRANRMCEVADVSQIDAALQSLLTREEGPFVVRLAKEPGRRDSRYMHLFSGPIEATIDAEPHAVQNLTQIPPPIDDDRLTRLEALVDSLCREIESLKRRMDGN
jgi:uncharacterized protein YceH (UPF0502 family)